MKVPLSVLESNARAIGTLIGGSLPPGVGFALMLFDFGDGGNLTYLSNANRGQLVTQLRECADVLEHNQERGLRS